MVDHTSQFLANRRGRSGSSDIFCFLGLHITVGMKAMQNLDSILKSKDITLPTNVCIVNPMVFPVVMYECESWTIKKAEC